jgi:hypothetical protein
MAVTVDIPEDMGGGSAYLTEAGQYHVTVVTVHENTMPPDKDGNEGKLLKNGGFSCTMEVLHGDHENKKFTLVFNNGDLTHKDQGLMARKKQAAFCFACDLIKPGVAGGVEIKLEDAVGSQCCAILELDTYKDNDGKERKQVKLNYSDIFHVDDPRAAKIAKNEASMKSIPAEYRHDAAYFEPLLGKKKTTGTKTETKTQSPVTDDDLADL